MAKLLRTMRPNKGLQAEYSRKLRSLVRDMCRSTEYWLCAAYRKRENRIVQDADPTQVPAKFLNWAVRRLQKFWLRKFSETAEKMARWFVGKNVTLSDSLYRGALKAAGLTVRMKPSRVKNDIVSALIAENVSLIKSIPSQFFQEVEGLIQRSVIAGRDVAGLKEDLQHRFDVTENRAKLIARDQNNKAFQAIKRVEAQNLGITEAIWVHVPGTKSSRQTHMRFNGKRFKLSEGLYDSDVHRNVLPGELVACNCTQRLIIPEFGDEDEQQS